MTHLSGHIHVRRSPQDVFDFLADEQNEPSYNPRMTQVVKTTDGPIGLGSRFTCVLVSGHRRVPMETEYTHFDRPRMLASRTRGAHRDVVARIAFESEAGGTHLWWSEDVNPTGVLRFMGPAVRLRGRRQDRAMWTRLKSHLEHADAPASAP